MVAGFGKRLRDAVKKFAGKGGISEKDLDELLKEMQRALIASDVDPRTVIELSKQIRMKSLDEKPVSGTTLKEHVLKVFYDELTGIMGVGGEIKTKPDTRIVLVGLYGSGKTTTAAKLGYFLKKKGVHSVLVSLDRDRPAALEQLTQLGESIGLKTEKEIVKGAVIIDTAGRDALDKKLLESAKKIVKKAKPDEVLLVIPAEMGHETRKQAEAFKNIITGVVITKMEGTAKAGGALSACSSAGVPVKFIGIGERVADLEQFNPARYVSRLLGWGDLQTLIEKVKETGMEVKPKDLDKLTLTTFYQQIESMTKLGPLEKVFQMVGLTDLDKKTVADSKAKLKTYKSVINSMTPAERDEPDTVTRSRIDRIAKGSGVKAEEIKELLREFKKMRKMMRNLKRGRNPAFMMGKRLKR
ncbi:MAG: signal recognition particle protein Srp19 [Candidatus Altiarchaeota archaeon]|nr:signal recognition particle protein Srp19 [Candidatus Altiarchaeota archaeon]